MYRKPYRLRSEARIYVKQIKKGSIIAELLPFAPFAIFGAHEIVSSMEQINAVNEFVRNYGSKLKAYFKKGGEVKDASRSDLKDFMGSLAAIANDPDGSASLEAAVFIVCCWNSDAGFNDLSLSC